MQPFPTPGERYQRYWTWCVILGVTPAPFEVWQQLAAAKVPEHLPVSWGRDMRFGVSA